MPDLVDMAPGPLRGRLLIAIVVTLVVGVIALAVGVGGGGDQPKPRKSTPVRAVAAAPSSATTPTVADFPSTGCVPASLALGSELGIGIPLPARLGTAGPEQSVFTAALACLQRITGQAPELRTQLPIDAMRRSTPADDQVAQLTAFASLLTQHGSPGIVSIRSHDFTQCGAGGNPKPTERFTLAAGEALAPCEYPSAALYGQLFAELSTALSKAAPLAAIQYTAWNEPDHPDFTLRPALGKFFAARLAGAYWAQAAAAVGADHMLAGEFADDDLPTLLRLRTAFVQGTGGVAPQAWALHPYRDLTDGTGMAVTDGFAQAVSPAPVWDTEITPRLSGQGGLNDDPGAQLATGQMLRDALTKSAHRAILYLLTPPPQPTTPTMDHWDSALADGEGRARPFVCGLAGLSVMDCNGSAAAYG